LSKATGAQLVGGGLLSVLIFPIIATKLGSAGKSETPV